MLITLDSSVITRLSGLSLPAMQLKIVGIVTPQQEAAADP